MRPSSRRRNKKQPQTTPNPLGVIGGPCFYGAGGVWLDNISSDDETGWWMPISSEWDIQYLRSLGFAVEDIEDTR